MKGSILFKLWTFPGSYETFLLNQIATAIDCGYEVKILLEDTKYMYNSRHKDLIDQLDIKNRLIKADYKVPSNKFLRIIKGLFLIFCNVRNTRSLFLYLKNHRHLELSNVFKFQFYKKLGDFDIIHVQYGTNAKPLDLLKKIGFLRSKLVVSFHGHDLHFPINEKIHDLNYYDLLFESADLLTANTPYLKSLLIKNGASQSKIKIVPVSVDTEYFQPLANKSRGSFIRLITVGRLDQLKGQIYGIEVAKILKEKGHDFRYTIVGSGPEFNFLSGIIRKYGLESYVKMAGEMSRNEIRDILNEHDIFLMTSITGPRNTKEAQGLVTAEAQACGLPIIGFDSGGVKYTFKDGKTGFLIGEGETEQMVLSLEKLIRNENLLNRMSKCAVNYIEANFSRKKTNRTWERLYDGMLD